MLVRHVTQLLWEMWFGDYILPEFVTCLIFLRKKLVLVVSTNTKYYRA